MAMLILYVVLALGVSFLCSIMEAVLLSVTPSFVALQVQRDRPWAAALRQLKEDIDRPLAAILSLNTVAHTVGAAGAGAQAGAVFGSASVGIISGVLTLLILVLSEIIPKTLGARYWRTLTPLVVRLLGPLIWLLWPLVRLSQGLTRLLAGDARSATVSRAEVSALAEFGHREGVIDESESRVIESLFRFPSLRVRDVMTPRTVLAVLPEDMTVGEATEREEEMRFSRIPIYGRDVDDVTGLVLKDEILLCAARGETGTSLRAIRREIIIVPNTLSLSQLLERLLSEGDHIALVVDEYGGTEGVVTLEDALETLLGQEIVDEADPALDMRALARKRWRQQAREKLLDERHAAIQLGLTGNRPTPSTDDDPESGKEP